MNLGGSSQNLWTAGERLNHSSHVYHKGEGRPTTRWIRDVMKWICFHSTLVRSIHLSRYTPEFL
jgi:hypothetical protein